LIRVFAATAVGAALLGAPAIARGSYSLAVGTGANPGTTLADSPLDSEGPIGLVGRLVELIRDCIRIAELADASPQLPRYEVHDLAAAGTRPRVDNSSTRSLLGGL